MTGEFVTLESLATFTGMVAATTLVVQFTKPLMTSSLPDWAVRIYVLTVAVVLQFFVLYVQGVLTAEAIGLGVINSFLVALTSMGGYEVLADPAAKKRKPYLE
jgi:hypothetical protein